jgi:hypothetical protein
VTVTLPQKSWVVPQKPYLEQQTFKGQVSAVDHCEPQPGSQSDLRSQLEMQFVGPQESGPRPHEPNFVQHPIWHGWVGLQVYWAATRRDKSEIPTSCMRNDTNTVFMANSTIQGNNQQFGKLLARRRSPLPVMPGFPAVYRVSAARGSWRPYETTYAGECNVPEETAAMCSKLPLK